MNAFEEEIKRIQNKPFIVCASGYFNPIHVGHIEYLEKAKKLGDRLVVIVNNDKQVKIKGSKKFMTQEDRVSIVSSLRCVDEVVLSIDEDETVCKTLQAIIPDIFCKGGDRFLHNIPETDVCDGLGIQMVFGLGDKIRSSSDYLNHD